MNRDRRYDILFEPVKIGPVVARNRFYQVPHCNGMGHEHPSAMAAMREVKAEGGWAVVSTEECEIHPSTDISPYVEARLWDDRDIPALARMVEGVKRHGALSAIELVHNGPACGNRYSREVPLAPSAQVICGDDPIQARAMDKQDIADFRRWHKNAALRAKRAGFDIVYVYAGHGLCLLQHFLSKRFNHRTDEYGGSLENRLRLMREVIEDTKEAVGDRCGVAVRLAVDGLLGGQGITSEAEGREAVEMLAELPDLWDVNVADWSNDSQTSRFAEEGYQERYIAFVKSLTSKPVVGVGRFTSPDAMVSQIRRGVLDMIGAARPSIADPWLPRKIAEGRQDEIRECIGCNICITGDMTTVPMRCTQNPTMAEEWRKGWHPERIAAKASDRAVLVVGGGPAGLEAARALGQRGYQVTLAEAGAALGGRVSRESELPGLAAWARVRDHRVHALRQMPNVDLYLNSELDAQAVLDFGFPVVALATGSSWRRDGRGRAHRLGLPIDQAARVFTPDDLMAGRLPQGDVLLYDDDHYYMGSVLAELLVQAGCQVTFVTPSADVAHYTHNTLEQVRIQTRLLELGVKIVAHRQLLAVHGGGVTAACVFTGRAEELAAAGVVLVTAKASHDSLQQDLLARRDAWRQAGLEELRMIGDAEAPGAIALAVYSGHRFARELDDPRAADRDRVPFRRELPGLGAWPLAELSSALNDPG